MKKIVLLATAGALVLSGCSDSAPQIADTTVDQKNLNLTFDQDSAESLARQWMGCSKISLILAASAVKKRDNQNFENYSSAAIIQHNIAKYVLVESGKSLNSAKNYIHDNASKIPEHLYYERGYMISNQNRFIEQANYCGQSLLEAVEAQSSNAIVNNIVKKYDISEDF